jgi:hypothetical protein
MNCTSPSPGIIEMKKQCCIPGSTTFCPTLRRKSSLSKCMPCESTMLIRTVRLPADSSR